MHNLDIKSDIKKSVKKFVASLKGNKLEEAQSQLNLLYKKFDKAAKNNILHKKTAARRKSRLHRLLAGISLNTPQQKKEPASAPQQEHNLTTNTSTQ